MNLLTSHEPLAEDINDINNNGMPNPRPKTINNRNLSKNPPREAEKANTANTKGALQGIIIGPYKNPNIKAFKYGSFSIGTFPFGKNRVNSIFKSKSIPRNRRIPKAKGENVLTNLLIDNPRLAVIIPIIIMNVNTPVSTIIPDKRVNKALFEISDLLDKYDKKPGYNGRTHGFKFAAIPKLSEITISFK